MTHSTNDNLHDHELLVSYLDGELEPDQASEVEQRLIRDEQFRLQLTHMRQTWDMLDELPQPTLDERFTKTTVEMVAVRSLENTTSGPKRNWLQRFGWLVASLACLAACFGFVRYRQASVENQFLADLPIILQLDDYRRVNDLQLLEQLAETEAFLDVVGDVETNELGSEETLTTATGPGSNPALSPVASREAARAWLATLTTPEKRELLNNRRRFNELPAAERRRLRSLYRQLIDHPQRQLLSAVMESYVSWLADQNAKERAAILELAANSDTAAEQIAEQYTQDGYQRLAALGLSLQDTKAAVDWYVDSVEANRDELEGLLDANKHRHRDKIGKWFFAGLLMHCVDPKEELIRRLPVDQLVNEVSERARFKYQAQTTAAERHQLVWNWLKESFHNRLRPPEVSDEELLRMIPRLPEAEQERLERLTIDQVVSELRDRHEQLWMERRRRHWKHRRGPDEHGPDHHLRHRPDRGPEFDREHRDDDDHDRHRRDHGERHDRRDWHGKRERER